MILDSVFFITSSMSHPCRHRSSAPGVTDPPLGNATWWCCSTATKRSRRFSLCSTPGSSRWEHAKHVVVVYRACCLSCVERERLQVCCSTTTKRSRRCSLCSTPGSRCNGGKQSKVAESEGLTLLCLKGDSLHMSQISLSDAERGTYNLHLCMNRCRRTSCTPTRRTSMGSWPSRWLAVRSGPLPFRRPSQVRMSLQHTSVASHHMLSCIA